MKQSSHPLLLLCLAVTAAMLVSCHAASDSTEALFAVDVAPLDSLTKTFPLPALDPTTYTTRQGHPYLIYTFANSDDEALFEHVQNLLPDYQIALRGKSEDGSEVLVMATSDRTPPTWYACRVDSDAVRLLHAPSQQTLYDQLSPVRPLTLTARDGAQLPVLLTLPRTLLPLPKEQKKLPLVVMPRPTSGMPPEWSYNPEVQLFALRGFAVLQIGTRSADDTNQQRINDVRDAIAMLTESEIVHPSKVSLFVTDDLPYTSAEATFHNPFVNRSVNPHHLAAFYDDLARKMKK